MEQARVSFADVSGSGRSGALLLEDDGRILLLASPDLAAAIAAPGDDSSADLTPLHVDDRRRGLALARSLMRGVRASLLTCEFVSGAFEVRAYIDGAWVRMTLKPGDFDSDAAWEFLVAANEARLEAAVA